MGRVTFLWGRDDGPTESETKRPAWPKQEECGATVKKVCLLCGREIEQGEWYDYVKPRQDAMCYVHHTCAGGHLEETQK